MNTDPDGLAGLYDTFENAAEAVPELAAEGHEVEVDVYHPTLEELTIEVELA